MENKKIKVGIGFATGRKHFQRVLRSYIYNWKESGLADSENISLNLFVAYDLNYMGTRRADYTSIPSDVSEFIDSKHFIGAREVEREKRLIAGSGLATAEEASLLFSKGYASQRNIIMYYAIKNGMDYLLYLDDDEYPVAATKASDTVLWSGQHVLKTHLENIDRADITYGWHCGYISPIPSIEFSEKMTEDVFRTFIQALSNDIVKWDNLKKIMSNGGVSYADTQVLISKEVYEVPEENSTKFISGSNLCINLTDPSRVFPFYNPPGARGEDTFLSTCLSERTVLRVPCYTFHDGFSSYNCLLSGVLPARLKKIEPSSEQIIKRFYAACVGWVRYKPLLLYITDREGYADKICEMKENLDRTLVPICEYFGSDMFLNIKSELLKYEKNVGLHYNEFSEIKKIWAKVIGGLPEITHLENHVLFADKLPILPINRKYLQ